MMNESKMILNNLIYLETLISEGEQSCKDNLSAAKQYPDLEAWTPIGLEALRYNLGIAMNRVFHIKAVFEILETSFRSVRDRLTEQEKMQESGGFRVDLNASRKRALREYNSIVKAVEEMIQTSDTDDCDDLKDHFEGLRTSLVSLAYTYIPDDPDFRDISDEIGEVCVFMKEESEEEDDK